MADPIDIIARLSVDATGVTTEIDKVNAKYAESNKELKKTQTQLDNLLLQEKKLLTARSLSTNPTATSKYNKALDDTRTKIEVQQKLTEQLTNVQKKYAAELDNTKSKLNSAFDSTKINSAKNAITGLAGAFGVALGAAALTSLIKDSAELASKAEGIETAFSRIGGEASLQKLRLATRGATSDLELMQAALRGQNFGISTDLLAKGLELAGKVARTTGQDVTYLTNSFVDGLGRKSIRILDNLQISQVQLQEEIKKTGDFNTAVGNIVNKKLVEMGEVADTTADKVGRLNAIWENFKKSIGNVVIDGLTNVADVFEAIFTKSTFSGIALRRSLAETKENLEKINGLTLDKAKESEAERLRLLSLSSDRIVALNTKLIQEDGDNLTEAQFKFTQLRLNNEKQLNGLLRNLNKKKNTELTDDDLAALKARKKLIADLESQLIDLEAGNIGEDFQRQRAQKTIEINRSIEKARVANTKDSTAIIIELNTKLFNEIKSIDESEIKFNQDKLDAMLKAAEDAALKEVDFDLKKKLKKIKIDQDELNEKQRHEAAILSINEASKLDQLDSEIKFEIARLNNLKKTNGVASAEYVKQNNLIIELTLKRAKTEEEIEEEARKKRKERNENIINGIQTIANAVISATNQILASEVKRVDGQISLQQKRVDEAEKIAEKGNATLLELEKDRLEKLQKEREKFVRAQQALALIELVANTAIAVSKAAAQGGAAAGVTIAAALIALVAGLASARSIASQAAFYEGGYTGDGNPRQESTALGKRPYTYHKAEFVHNHETTKKYRSIFQEVHDGKLDLNKVKEKADLYDILKLNRIDTSRDIRLKSVDSGNSMEIGKLKSSIENVVEAVKSIPGTNVRIDEDGIAIITTRYQKNRDRINTIAR